MKIKVKNLMIMALASVSIEVLVTSCIREEKDNINVDITDVQPSFSGSGIVKTTIQENGVTLYADMTKTNPADLDLNINISSGATWNYVDVKMDSTFIEYYGKKIFYPGDPRCTIDTTVVGELPAQKDFTKTQYVKVTAQATGIAEEDKETAKGFNKFAGMDSNNHLWKIWTINLLPAGVPTKLSFDNWYSPAGCKYEHPYEMIDRKKSYIWSSTNNSINIMKTLDGTLAWGADSTNDVATADEKNTHALVLTTNDIGIYRPFDKQKPVLAGCMFVGEFIASQSSDALNCTHVGLPFDKKPKTLKFYYKYKPTHINYDQNKPLDTGFIKAVLFRTDNNVQYLTGGTIRDNSYPNTVAYAELYPECDSNSDPDYDPSSSVNGYVLKQLPFTYVKDVNEDDLKNWKYSLAIYFASSKEGFNFVGGPGTQLFIDEMEVVCEE